MALATVTADVRGRKAGCGSDYCTDATCQHVAAEQDGRWFILMGHAGFNSPANNGRGYESREQAISASLRYGARRVSR